MTFKASLLRCSLAWALSLTVPAVAYADALYRYRNAEGVVVMGFQVPNESIPGGYEVLNEKGMVVKVIPRQLTEEEREQQDAQERLLREAKAEEERLRKWDESLMLRYSTVADIEDRKRRAMGELEIRLAILKNNRRGYKQQIENYQRELADTERSGAAVDVERLREIENLQEEIENIDRDIVVRQEEVAELSAAYQADIERFEMLQEAVELRRTLSARRSTSTQ